MTHVQVRLSTLRYLSKYLRLSTATNQTTARYRDASFLRLSKIVVPITCFGTSPLPAGRSIDLEPRLRNITSEQ